MMEYWKVIPGWEGYYEVSSTGRVRRISTGRILKPFISAEYVQIVLCRNGKGKFYRAHELVALAFLGPKPFGHEVDHGDLNKQNNNVDNLEYVTPLQNIQRALAAGKLHGRAKKHLLDDEVREILREFPQGTKAMEECGLRYGVSGREVRNIVEGKRHQHVLDEAK